LQQFLGQRSFGADGTQHGGEGGELGLDGQAAIEQQPTQRCKNYSINGLRQIGEDGQRQMTSGNLGVGRQRQGQVDGVAASNQRAE
jgi:hypothetical protein